MRKWGAKLVEGSYHGRSKNLNLNRALWLDLGKTKGCIMAEKVKAHAIITGLVQGVFFRMETQHTAQKHGVFGWVRNKHDGSVEAVFEGEKGEVEAVLAWCRRGPRRAVVNNVKVQWQEYTGEFNGFQVTY